ncbi:hypothetical protein JTE90_008278 [Oedothorax gibbosus]|uniref:Reverse transcriptase domain-containing protein n=1 Tax=Oedothorax gibbosus TaxID=931172 RepID=A0AAV6UJ81_9ARAC|nr:hypothetical protein JTE90_008278 [Oedothorax gibbosus]
MTRVFQVRVGSTLSRDFYQREGVPQGSVLSVVFILMINDIVRQLLPTVKGTLFVDDFQISCASANISTVERQLQIAIHNILDWTNNNDFVIFNQKTICMHFCRKRGLHPDPEIILNGVALPVRSETKFLGIIFDMKLTFLPHIQHPRQKCNKSLNILKVLFSTTYGADTTSMLRIYRALIRSKLEYGVAAYGSARKSAL